MSHSQLGHALVINNIRFESSTCKLADRKGADADAAKIHQTFSCLGLDVDLISDVTYDEIVAKCTEG